MLDSEGVVIYIGKAKHLKRRVSSYFNKTHDDPKTTVLVSRITDMEWIVTQSEHEALILERQLIREIKPRYNVMLKDDKSYPYIKVTLQDPFPRVVVVREKEDDGAAYFGPYTSIGSSKFMQRTLYSLFPLRDCKKAIDLEKKQRKCIQLDLGNCIGPCVIKSCKPQYDAWVQQLMCVLQGKNTQLVRQLTEEMTSCAKKREYEKAATLRDRIDKILALQAKQVVDLDTRETYHVWAVAENDHFYYVLIQRIIKGKALYQHGFYCPRDEVASAQDFLEQCLLSFLADLPERPHRLLCQDHVADVVREHVQWVMDRPSVVTVPKRGPKADVMAMVEKNAALALKRVAKDHATQWVMSEADMQLLLEDAQSLLGLSKVPQWILGFDISHFQGADIVASSVSFVKGEKHSSTYRKFKVKSVVDTSDDPASMAEVVKRRMGLCVKEDTGYPDLLLIDGGKPQLNAVVKALKDLNLYQQIDVVALAKREEELWRPHQQRPVRLPYDHGVLQLFQRVRDESHRFANTFQKQRRSKRFFDR